MLQKIKTNKDKTLLFFNQSPLVFNLVFSYYSLLYSLFVTRAQLTVSFLTRQN